MINKRYLISGLVVVIVIFFSMKIYNEYREKSLDEVIGYYSSSLHSFVFKFIGDNIEWKTDKEVPLEELIEFLSRYQVKKMKDVEWNSDVSKEEGFDISIYSKGKPILVSIYEERIHLLSGHGYYKVINGPINMDWVKKYHERYKK